jgi:hypothetical protein
MPKLPCYCATGRNIPPIPTGFTGAETGEFTGAGTCAELEEEHVAQLLSFRLIFKS